MATEAGTVAAIADAAEIQKRLELKALLQKPYNGSIAAGTWCFGSRPSSSSEGLRISRSSCLRVIGISGRIGRILSGGR